ncbi:unnamed protein product [Leptidea sinapis]|uniref:Uncharacterized protein n=1 Tax=Leptidea sinapis TaxID=189913 RepID=A0A5E4R0T3_9NEOP|nr:unnamed protein product [Leptidea sinapis]
MFPLFLELIQTKQSCRPKKSCLPKGSDLLSRIVPDSNQRNSNNLKFYRDQTVEIIVHSTYYNDLYKYEFYLIMKFLFLLLSLLIASQLRGAENKQC